MGNYIFLSKDTETKEKVLQVLNLVQSRLINIKPWVGYDQTLDLVYEDWDWLVVMQWLQDNGLLKSNPMRPPLTAFEQWLRENYVPQYRTHYSAYELSLAHRHIGGARYPWSEVKNDLGMIRRWRILYNDLTRLMNDKPTK